MTSPAPVELDEVLSPAWLTECAVGALTGRRGRRGAGHRDTQDRRHQGPLPSRVDDAAATRPARRLLREGRTSTADPASRSGGGRDRDGVLPRSGSDLPVRTPPCVYTGVDPDTGHGVVLMHDLVAAGCTFLTALSPYIAEQAAATLDQLAQLHAAQWADPALAGVEWLAPRLATLTSTSPSSASRSCSTARASDKLPSSITGRGAGT